MSTSLRISTDGDLRAAAVFRWLAKRYRAVVNERVDVGEQLRAILQGRDRSWGALGLPDKPAHLLLGDVRRGTLREPSPIADVYRRLYTDEQALLGDLAERLEQHPAWGWLREQRGIGAALAAQLVARLDRDRAPRPSSFWAFCGLATIAAELWVCDACGARVEVVTGRRVPRLHRRPDDRAERCTATLVLSGAPTVRIAQSRGATAQFMSYDRTARRVCHLIGVSMLRTRGAYEPVYRTARTRFADMQPKWPKIRCHASALRVMEKRFLLDLWHAWPATGQCARPGADGPVVRTPWLDGEALPRIS